MTAGIALAGVWFAIVPLFLGRTVLRGLRRNMGRGRYALMILLLLLMLLLPVKMVLRWTGHISYIVSMPESSLNL